jgi:hypothetical protein
MIVEDRRLARLEREVVGGRAPSPVPTQAVSR